MKLSKLSIAIIALAVACGGAPEPASSETVTPETITPETITPDSVAPETEKPSPLPASEVDGDQSGGDDSGVEPSGSPLADPEAADSSAGSADEAPEAPALASWNRLLAAHQIRGGLDYSGIQAAPEDLRAFLKTLPEADLSPRSREEKIAFWVNAYNALIVDGVLQRYPGLESVIRVEGFFDRERHRVAGLDLTLNEIERQALDLDEPRVHFAVVCASTGCPDLRGDAFTAADLETQLAEQTRAFLADGSKGLRYDAGANELWLSSIFDWYAADFGGDVVAWVQPWVPEALAKTLRERSPTVRFLEYDWSPNDRKR